MAWCEQSGDDVLIRVKAVPGASRDQIAGLLGERLKIRVAAPPEGGKANVAICALLAKAIGVAKRAVEVESGATNPEKTVRVAGTSVERVSSACL
ncbi:MAG: YggU family protein [Phycisphaerae bacterium]|jgi:uncharacterized protein (TIGR00251 family)|nr:YggU family protein [Phycisphaerae bacterium]